MNISNVLFISLLIVLSITMIGCGIRKIYRYLYIGYHVRVSDSDTPYLNLRFIGYHDELEVHTLASGKKMYHIVKQLGYQTTSQPYQIPEEFDTPYDYIMSGEIDEKIRYTRLLTDLKTVTKGMSITADQPNRNHLENLPIKFHDVSDEVRRKLGLTKRD